jgi:hypothetical protein
MLQPGRNKKPHVGSCHFNLRRDVNAVDVVPEAASCDQYVISENVPRRT